MSSVVTVMLLWVICIVLLVLCVYLVSRYASWLEKQSVKFVCLTAVLGLGLFLFGYYFGNGEENAPVWDLFSILSFSFVSMGRLFTMEMDIGELGTMKDNPVFRMIYGFILLFAVFSLVITVLSVIGTTVLCNVRLLFLRRFGTGRKTYLIYAHQDELFALTEDIRKKEPKSLVIFLFRKEDQESVNKSLLRRLVGAGGIKGNYELPGEQGVSFRFPFKKCRNELFLIAAEEDSLDNIRLTEAFCRGVREKRIEGRQIHIYASVSLQRDTDILEDDFFQPYDVHWLDRDDLAVREVLWRHPLIPEVFGYGDFTKGTLPREIRVLVLGYSGLAECLYRRLIPSVQFKGSRLKIIAVAEDITEKTAAFINLNPELKEAVDFETVDAVPFGTEFFSCLKRELKSADGVFCVFEEDEQNRKAAHAVTQMEIMLDTRTALYTHLSRKLPCPSEGYGIYFGENSHIYTHDIFINERLDVMARSIHTYYGIFYGMGRQEAQDSWKSASVTNKQSSRSMALHIPVKLYGIGYRMTDGAGKSGYEEFMEKHPDIVCNLAEGEHLRWEAVYFLDGWQGAKKDEVFPQNANKDRHRKRHVCLIPWEELPAAGEKYGVDYRFLDIHLIRELEKVVNDAGYRLVKTEEERQHGISAKTGNTG